MSRIAREYPEYPEAWDQPLRFVPPPSPRCKCSHAKSMHYRDRKDRPTCGSAACGCASYREDVK